MRKLVRSYRRDQIFPSILDFAPKEEGTGGRLHRRQVEALRPESVSMVREDSSGKEKYQWLVLG